MKLIAESGSTRTEWALVEDNHLIQRVFTEGLNPFFQTRREISRSVRLGLPEIFFKKKLEQVYYYGAGCFAIVLEKIPAALAERVSSELTIPIIGIGAGGGVDGQVLVVQDMLGMNNGFRPRFLRRYADLHTVMTDAISHYISDVKNLDFPNEKEQY